MTASKIAVRKVSQSDGFVASGPCGFFGLCSLNDGVALSVYDNFQASGTKLYAGTLSKGQRVEFGGNGFAAKSGLFVEVTTAGEAEILYTGGSSVPGVAPPLNLGGFSNGFSSGFSGGV